jgi:hypothetical protein
MSDDVKVRNGLESLWVALPCVGHMPAPGKVENEAARCFMLRRRGLRRGWLSGLGAMRNSGKSYEISGE